MKEKKVADKGKASITTIKQKDSIKVKRTRWMTIRR